MKFFLHPRTSVRQIFAICAISLTALLGSSCHTAPLPKYVTEFYLEAPNQSGIAFTLPMSHLTYHRMSDPFLDLSKVVGVEQGRATVIQPGDTPGVFFYMNDDGRERLNIATSANHQRHLFLFLNEKPMGAYFIDQPIDSGQLFMTLEVPDKELPAYVADLKESIKRLKDLKNK